MVAGTANARRREVVAARVVALAPEIDRERHPQGVGILAVAFVVAVQTAEDRGDEHIVDAALGDLGGPPHVVERKVEDIEATPEAAIAHDR